MKKDIHMCLDLSQHAPCGVRIAVTHTEYAFGDKGMRLVSHNEEAAITQLGSSTSMLDRVTCVECQYVVTNLAKAFNRARRLKLIEWGGKDR